MNIKNYIKFYKYKKNNNKIYAIKNGVKHLLLPNKNIKISGYNNEIILNCDNLNNFIKKFPKGLRIKINGNNNICKIEYPIKFENVTIILANDNNLFDIQSTPHKFAGAYLEIADESSVIIGKNSEISSGNFYCIARHNYKKPHKLVIGQGVHIARDTIIRLCDGETFIDPITKQALNEPQDIIIGDNVWLMTRCMVVKGAVIPNGCAIAPYSFVNKKYKVENLLLAGIPAQIKKENIKWIPKSYKGYMRDCENEEVIYGNKE